MEKLGVLDELCNYVDGIFFYCVKHCNNVSDAEDLSQTILIELINSINKGARINNLDSYIWGVCKNQYIRYVKSKINKREKEVATGDRYLEFIDEQVAVLDEMITDEQIIMMNRELKLLSKDYVDIVYRYYVEDMTLKKISEELNLPLNTVKTKLYRTQKKLKERVYMERINGKKAYIPENYMFNMSCNNYGKYKPWDYTNTLINKNLLYHSYNNPCTLEDYALELGISLPYIEDIVERLIDVTLLKQLEDGKYVTNFAFLSAEFRMKCYQIARDFTPKFTKAVMEYCKYHFNEYKGIINSNLHDEALMWSLLFIVMTECESRSCLEVKYTKRPGNGQWDFLGMEYLKENLDFYFVGCNGNFDNINWRSFVFPFRKRNIEFMGSEEDSDIFVYIKKNDIKFIDIEKLADKEIKNRINNMINKGYITVIEDELEFNFVYKTSEQFKQLNEKLNFEETLENCIKILNNYTLELQRVVKNYVPSYLNGQIPFITDTINSNIRSKLIDAFDEEKLLDFAEDKERFTYNLIVIEK